MPYTSSSAIENQLYSQPLLTLRKWIRCACLIFGGLGTWFGFAFRPITFELPEQLRSVDEDSPTEIGITMPANKPAKSVAMVLLLAICSNGDRNWI